MAARPPQSVVGRPFRAADAASHLDARSVNVPDQISRLGALRFMLPVLVLLGGLAVWWLFRARLLRSRTVGIAIGLALTALLLWRTGPAEVASGLRHTNLLVLAGALALLAPVVLLRTWRSRLLLQRLGARVPLWRVTTSQVIGLTLSGITPAAGGDLVRAYLWHRDDGVPVRSGALVVIFERVWSLILMGLVGVLATALPVADWRLRLLAAVSCLCVGLLWLGGRLGLPTWALSRMTHLPLVRRAATPLERSADEVTMMSEDLVLQVQFSVLSLLVFALSGAQVWLLVLGLGRSVTYLAAIAAYCLSQVGGAISSLPFGLGAGDVLLVVILAQAGLHSQLGAAVAVLLRVTTTLPIALAAAGAWALTVPGHARAARAEPR